MRLRFSLTLILSAVGLIASASNAQEYARISSYKQHQFLSAPIQSASSQRIFYQACNLSKENSAFRWNGAGFGLTALAQLKPQFCAYKNEYTESEITISPKNVSFQGGYSGDIETWHSTHVGAPFERIYSNIQAFVDGPDGFVSMSDISISIRRNEDKSVTINITSSGEYEEVIIVFPNSAEEDIDISKSFIEKISPYKSSYSEISFLKFENIKFNNDTISSNILIDDIKESSSTISFRNLEKTPSGISFLIKDSVKLGDQFTLLGKASGTLIIRSDTTLSKSG